MQLSIISGKIQILPPLKSTKTCYFFVKSPETGKKSCFRGVNALYDPGQSFKGLKSMTATQKG